MPTFHTISECRKNATDVSCPFIVKERPSHCTENWTNSKALLVVDRACNGDRTEKDSAITKVHFGIFRLCETVWHIPQGAVPELRRLFGKGGSD